MRFNSAVPVVVPAKASPAGGSRAWPLWAKIATPVVGLVAVASVIGAISPKNDRITPAVQPIASIATATSSPTSNALSTTTLSPTTTIVVTTTAAPVTVAPTPVPAAATDPRFDTCKLAKANGYGPYYSGTDPEYDWYRDADSDGIVCE